MNNLKKKEEREEIGATVSFHVEPQAHPEIFQKEICCTYDTVYFGDK